MLQAEAQLPDVEILIRPIEDSMVVSEVCGLGVLETG